MANLNMEAFKDPEIQWKFMEKMYTNFKSLNLYDIGWTLASKLIQEIT